jgi:hypothetical protein
MATVHRQGRPPGDHDQRRQDVTEAVWAMLGDKGLEAIIAADSPAEAIRQIMTGMQPKTEQSRLEWAAWLGFIARGPWSPAFADLRERRTTQIRAIIRQLLEKAIAAGEVDPSVDPADRADALVGFVEEMCIVNTSVDGKDLDRRRSQLILDHLPLFLSAPKPKG